MVSCRPLPSGKCIKGKDCGPAGSNYYYNDYVLITSGAALRSATPVETASKMVILVNKMTCWSVAALCIQSSRSWEFKALSFAQSGNILPQNAASAAMVQAGGWQKVLGTANKIRSTDQVGTPSKK